jgi:hypothetical protein
MNSTVFKASSVFAEFFETLLFGEMGALVIGKRANRCRIKA